MFRRGIFALTLCGHASAQERGARLVVPYPGGGLSDRLAHRLARRMEMTLGRAVVVENHPEDAGMTATLEVARARPDGRTLLLASASHLATQPLMPAYAGFDPLADLTPVSILGAGTVAVIVRPEGAADLAALAADSLARPGALRCGTSAPGSYLHLVAEALKQAAGGLQWRPQHFPFDGPSLAALLASEVDVVTDVLANTLQHHRAGRLRILAVASAGRSPLLPAVPTVAEALALPHFEASLWLAVMLPPGATDSLRDRIAYSINSILADAGLRTEFARNGFEVGGLLSAPEIRPFIQAEQAQWRPLVLRLAARAP